MKLKTSKIVVIVFPAQSLFAFGKYSGCANYSLSITYLDVQSETLQSLGLTQKVDDLLKKDWDIYHICVSCFNFNPPSLEEGEN